ncbi:MAG: hypothetical protein LBD93_02505 [Treponema sp.]|jgi:hypothetical protein|nr:hypothetical protein [Treponema sp.]
MKVMGIRRLVEVMVLLGITRGMAAAEGLTVSGVLDSSITAGAGTGEVPDFFYGVEEYANLRVQGKLREGLSFYSAFNLIAAAGISALGLERLSAPGLNAASQNYAATIELERLFFRLNREYLDIDGGLLRIAAGYGQVFGPSDFLNPKNPLQPDARPRAVLGGTLAAYPADSFKVQVFAAAPKNPFVLDGGGFLGGILGEKHGDRASLQALYTYEAPEEASLWGIHRGGFSLKADLHVGFVADVLYTYKPQEDFGFSGLSASAGLDYSFLEGQWYVLAEYLYNGSASATSVQSGNATGFSGEQFLYGAIQYRVNDYTSLTLACLSALSDGSFAPLLSGEHELIQGFTLSMSAQVPLDRDVFFKDGNLGELGPNNAQERFLFRFKTRLRF